MPKNFKEFSGTIAQREFWSCVCQACGLGSRLIRGCGCYSTPSSAMTFCDPGRIGTCNRVLMRPAGTAALIVERKTYSPHRRAWKATTRTIDDCYFSTFVLCLLQPSLQSGTYGHHCRASLCGREFWSFVYLACGLGNRLTGGHGCYI